MENKNVLVEIWNYKTKSSDWLPGVITGTRPGEPGGPDIRFNVLLSSGREIHGCHPNCVKFNP